MKPYEGKHETPKRENMKPHEGKHETLNEPISAASGWMPLCPTLLFCVVTNTQRARLAAR